MKKLLMVAAIFAMTFAGVFAQKGQGGPRGGQQKESMTPVQRAERITIKMTEELGLSKDQKQKIYQINLENAEKRQAQRDAMQEEQKSKRTEMQAQNKARNERMEAILTSEQKTRWDEVKKDNRDKIREGSRRGQRGGKGGSGSGSGSSII